MLFRSGTIRIPFEPNDKARERERPIQRVELDPEHDRHARAALEAYADSSAHEMPWLAEWMREALGSPQPELTRCAQTVERVFDLAHAWAAGSRTMRAPRGSTCAAACSRRCSMRRVRSHPTRSKPIPPDGRPAAVLAGRAAGGAVRTRSPR